MFSLHIPRNKLAQIWRHSSCALRIIDTPTIAPFPTRRRASVETRPTFSAFMDKDIQSGSDSTIDDDWVKDPNASGSSSVKDVVELSTPSEGSPAQKDSDLKAKKWVRLLGLANRPDPMLHEFDNLYNLKSQNHLRNDCRALAKTTGRTVPELESFLTLYCKKLNVDYDINAGWLTILERLLSYGFENDVLFNAFFALTTKYIPRDTSPGAQVFDLFRLLLQYHEPELSSHLESIKCSPHIYTRDWFSTLFACSLSEKASMALWDLYIERSDPFLVFFLALAMAINSKEDLLAITKENREQAITLLSKLPKSITIEDLNDFVEIGMYYSTRTPQCLREDFHGTLFGANYSNDFVGKNIRQMICLSVTPHELLRKDLNTAIEASQISYFVIDCRSQDAFKAGQVYGSFNLDAQLFVDAPEQFAFAHKAQEEYKSAQHPEDHYCFLGYGDPEKDQYMNMVISKFLRDGKMHVSFLEGGYRALHLMLAETGRLKIISSHDSSRCPECPTNSPSKSAWGLVGLVKNAVISKSSAVKEKMHEVLAAPPTPETPIRHADPKDRHGKKYKSEKSVFSLEDDASDDDPFDGDEKPKPETEKKKVPLDTYMAQADVLECFECQEVMKGGFLIPAHIALTRTHMHILHDVLGTTGIITTESRHSLPTILRVTSKKNIPELLTFKFGYEQSPNEHNITSTHRFLVPKAGECAKSVKSAIFSLRPPFDSE